MARTFKDQPAQLASQKKKKEIWTRSYLRTKNPRLEKYDSVSDEEICPRCSESLEYVNGVPFCDSCGWSTVEDVVDEMDKYDAA